MEARHGAYLYQALEFQVGTNLPPVEVEGCQKGRHDQYHTNPTTELYLEIMEHSARIHHTSWHANWTLTSNGFYETLKNWSNTKNMWRHQSRRRRSGCEACLVLSCLVLSCLVVSCRVLSWLIVAYRGLSCLVLSCLLCLVSCVMCHVYCVLRRLSRVLCLVSCVLCLMSCVLCLVSCVLRLVACVLCLWSCLLPLSLVLVSSILTRTLTLTN